MAMSLQASGILAVDVGASRFRTNCNSFVLKPPPRIWHSFVKLIFRQVRFHNLQYWSKYGGPYFESFEKCKETSIYISCPLCCGIYCSFLTTHIITNQPHTNQKATFNPIQALKIQKH